MTGPIDFNPFQGILGTESLEQIPDRRKTLRFPEIDLAPVDLNISQGQDDEGEVMLDKLDFNFNKQIPKN